MVAGRTLGIASCALASVLSWPANAQDAGGSRIESELRLTGAYTDNFYYATPDSGEETSTLGGIIAPRLAYRGSRDRFDVTAGLEAEAATFDVPESTDDYLDGKAGAGLTMLASRRSRFDLRGGFQRGHDPFGTNRTENAAARDADLDIWHQATGGATFRYGTPEAVLNAEVGVSTLAKSYQTNEAATRFLDYDSTAMQYTLYYNISPKTAALFDYVRTGVEFDESFGGADTRSGAEYRMRAGMRWLATAKTSGDIRVGYFRREFDNTAISEGGFDWQAGVQWAPRARTVLELNTARASQESYRADSNVSITRSGAAIWRQNWTARTSTSLRFGTTRSEFIGAGRDDTLYNGALTLDHQLRRSLSLVLGVETFSRDSNDPSSEFDRFSSYLGIRLGR